MSDQFKKNDEKEQSASTDRSQNAKKRNKNKNKGGNQIRVPKPSDRDGGKSTGGTDFVPPTAERNAMNDVGWYTRYEALSDAASKFPFMNKPGDFIGGGGLGTPNVMGKDIPGIIRLEYQAAIGSSKDNSSPASICAKGIWDQIRDAYSGAIHAEPADIFMYMMHLDQFQAFIAWYKRVYGILNYYTPFNHLMPYSLFKAMFPHTVSIDETVFYQWVAKKNDILNYINQLVYMCNKYVVPSDMAIFDRHRFMNEAVYRDADSVLSQLYVFAPTGFWYVDGVHAQDGTFMQFVPFSNVNIRQPELAFEYGVEMYRRLAGWGDAKTINGYLMRAFEGKFYPPAELISIDYAVRPVYVPEVLLQIHNARIFKQYMERTWTQNALTGEILCTPEGLQYNLGTPWLDIPADIPSQSAIIIASRLAPVITGYGDNREMHCGTEICTGMYITERTNASDTLSDVQFLDVDYNVVNKLGDDVQRHMNLARPLWILSSYTAFQSAPIVPFSYREADEGHSAMNEFDTLFGEVSNLTLVDSEALSRLHLVCQQSEFNIYRARFA